MFNRRALGAEGEKKGVSFLKKQGYKIVEKNFHTRYGEIDIISKDKDDLVFVEVKLRRSEAYGKPQEAVNPYKQQRIIKSALQYIKANNLFEKNVRFDVLLIGPESEKIELIKSAFIADSKYMY